MKSANVLLLLCLVGAPVFAARSVEEFQTSAGPLKITILQHASFFIEAGGQVVAVDPAQGPWDSAPKADLILITDIHGDHLSPAIIQKLKKSGGSSLTLTGVGGAGGAVTRIIAPKAVAATVTEATVMNNGDTQTIGPWKIEAIPMYNLKRGPSAGTFYHDKGRGNGYVVTYGNFRIYIAGDTENIPEMRALRNIDVAFVPMNLPYTMTPEEAAEAVRAFKPKIVYPYHYMGSDINAFAAALRGSMIDVRLRNWY
jgi:L-ascorbate metabolism protein UlaG (beta-lactamase superfamily)